MSADDIETLTGIMAVRKDGHPKTTARSRAIARNVALKIHAKGFRQITPEIAEAMRRVTDVAYAMSGGSVVINRAKQTIDELLEDFEEQP